MPVPFAATVKPPPAEVASKIMAPANDVPVGNVDVNWTIPEPDPALTCALNTAELAAISLMVFDSKTAVAKLCAAEALSKAAADSVMFPGKRINPTSASAALTVLDTAAPNKALLLNVLEACMLSAAAALNVLAATESVSCPLADSEIIGLNVAAEDMESRA